MRHLLAAALLALAACSVRTEPTSPDPGPIPPCPTLEAGPAPEPDAGHVDAAPADAGPSALAVTSVEPATVDVGASGGTLVVARGSGFLRVRDVEVSVVSVPFTIVDDTRIDFYAPAREVAPGDLPYRAEVDIIVKPADQVQTWITYR